MNFTPEMRAKAAASRAAKAGKKITHTIQAKDGGTVTFDDYKVKLAVRLKCVECFGWETHPENCTSPKCPLFPFRGNTLASYHSSPNKKG